MTKQALVENVLDLWLSQRQLEYVKNEWKAFYNDPLAYKDTIVVDLVKHDLETV